jgi:hypothetical protein
MLNAQFRPLEHWPGERNKYRKDSTFRATYPKTLDELENELSKIRAKEIIIQVEGLTRDDIRNDGWPRSGNWKNGYGGPGVIVSFESPKGAMSFPCDKFRDWQDNLRAIAKSLEALRMVDRYGVTRGNEQYKGWAQLPPSNGQMDQKAAVEFLNSLLGAGLSIQSDRHVIAAICKRAKIEYHPDQATDENAKLHRHEIFVRIGQAEEVLCS